MLATKVASGETARSQNRRYGDGRQMRYVPGRSGGAPASILFASLQECRHEQQASELRQAAGTRTAEETASDPASRWLLYAMWLFAKCSGIDLAPPGSRSEIIPTGYALAFKSLRAGNHVRTCQVRTSLRQLPCRNTCPALVPAPPMRSFGTTSRSGRSIATRAVQV